MTDSTPPTPVGKTAPCAFKAWKAIPANSGKDNVCGLVDLSGRLHTLKSGYAEDEGLLQLVRMLDCRDVSQVESQLRGAGHVSG